MKTKQFFQRIYNFIIFDKINLINNLLFQNFKLIGGGKKFAFSIITWSLNWSTVKNFRYNFLWSHNINKDYLAFVLAIGSLWLIFFFTKIHWLKAPCIPQNKDNKSFINVVIWRKIIPSETYILNSFIIQEEAQFTLKEKNSLNTEFAKLCMTNDF